MPANTQPIFVKSISTSVASIATANTGRDGSGTLNTLFTAGANGSRVEFIKIMATVTTTAGMLRLFIDDGGTIRFFMEVPVVAITPSATVGAFMVHLQFGDAVPFMMKASTVLKCGTEKNETFHAVVVAGDY